MSTVHLIRALLEQKARSLAGMIDGAINHGLPPKTVGFALLLFEMNAGATEEGWLTWISNAQRADMLKSIEELRARFKREELAGPTPSDIDDVAKTFAAVAPGCFTETLRAIAAVAISLGASPGLARADASGAGPRDAGTHTVEVPR